MIDEEDPLARYTIDENDPRIERLRRERKARQANGKDQQFKMPVLHRHGEKPRSPPQWLFRKFAPRQCVILFSGKSERGKTYVAIEAAVAAMIGADYEFAGEPVRRRGGVLYISAESPEQIQPRVDAIFEARVKPWYASRGLTPPAVMPFFWIEEVPNLGLEGALAWTRDVCQLAKTAMAKDGVELVLIIVDTLSAAAAFKDPNDAGEAQRIMNLMHSIKVACSCVVLVIDHMGKNEDAGTRGSSAKEWSAEVVWYAIGEKPKNGKNPKFNLWVEKNRLGKSQFGIDFELVELDCGVSEDGDELTQRMVMWQQPQPHKYAENNKSWPALQVAIDKAMSVHGRVYDLKDGRKPKAVTHAELSATFAVQYVPSGDTAVQRKNATRMALKRSIDLAKAQRLIDTYQLETTEVLVWKTH